MSEYELADSIASMIAVLLTWIGLSFTIVMFIALKFMWDVRHPKA
jgi:hypothetical protein